MKNESRHIRKRLERYDGLFYRNSVLFYGMALPFVVVACNTVKNGAALSIAMFMATIPAVLISSLFLEKLPLWSRAVFNSMVAMAFVVGSYYVVSPISAEIFDSLGMYLPMMAINTIMLTLCERYTAQKPGRAVRAAIRYSFGFGAVAMLVSAIREYLGNGTLWGIALPIPIKLYGLVTSFGGFILLAFLAVISKSIWNRVIARAERREASAGEDLPDEEPEAPVGEGSPA